jgi:hypothetical protein
LEIVSLRVNTPYIEVYTKDGYLIKNVQVSLIWPLMSESSTENVLKRKKKAGPVFNALDFDVDTFEVLFQAELKPLSISSFRILKAQGAAKLAVTNFFGNRKSRESIITKINKTLAK